MIGHDESFSEVENYRDGNVLLSVGGSKTNARLIEGKQDSLCRRNSIEVVIYVKFLVIACVVASAVNSSILTAALAKE